jgi:galactokinase
MNVNLERLVDLFLLKHGTSTDPINIFFAPGRVNLIGEHTDYNDGVVLPCAINYGTFLLARINHSNRIRLSTTNFRYSTTVTIDNSFQPHPDEWVNYPLGVFNEFLKMGLSIPALDLLYSGNIPSGAGLSSSASIEMITAFAINDITALNLGMIDLIKMSQRAENSFVGVNCGIMDQFAVGVGQRDHAILLDCKTLEYEQVAINFTDYILIVANTNKKRKLSDSKYNERVLECNKALNILKKYTPIQALGDLSVDDFEQYKTNIADDILRKRVAHVVYENERVRQATEALKSNDLSSFGLLMYDSHSSLRENYEVTGYELDSLVEAALAQKGVLGSRMTGAGFGGCTVNLVHQSHAKEFLLNVEQVYYRKTGLMPDFYQIEISGGVRRYS